MKQLAVKLKESLFAVLPITLTVVALGLILGIFDVASMIAFIVGSLMLILGMGMFTLGADTAMMPMGETLGGGIVKTRKLWLILGVSFVTGVLVTIAEPGLLVLAERLSSGMVGNLQLQKWIIVIVVGIGVGIFLLIAMLKTIFKINLRILLIIFYGVLFALALTLTLVGKGDFLAVAFDSGGATTGAITVPFIMAYGMGIAAIKGGEEASDSFGYIGLASIGPIIAVLIWGIFSTPPSSFPETSLSDVSLIEYLKQFPTSLLDVLIPLAAIFAFYLLFQLTIIRLPRKKMRKLVVGLIYTLLGLAIFLTGANVGFSAVGNLIGKALGESQFKWVLIPIGVLVGCFIVAAEPAIVVLNEKVEEISGGIIKKRVMLISLMCAIGASIGLSMVRILYNINIWWFIAPIYGLALILMFFVPKVYTAVAFDSGGVASGPMTSAFLLPLAMGACAAVGGNILTEAFGVIAFVAMTPLLTIQVVGLFAVIKQRKQEKSAAPLPVYDDYEIIELV